MVVNREELVDWHNLQEQHVEDQVLYCMFLLKSVMSGLANFGFYDMQVTIEIHF